jgi:hypothetical protein
MGNHDLYGKAVMRQAVGAAFQDRGNAVQVSYGGKGGATIDGVVADTIAVEIESRVSKQVRGAVLDLICHEYPKKLLVLLPVHMSNPQLCSEQCCNILNRFIRPENYQVVVLKGHGSKMDMESDAARVRIALQKLGHTEKTVESDKA